MNLLNYYCIADRDDFPKCFTSALQWTQSCNNTSPFYTTIIEKNSELGLEFGNYLSKALLFAVLHNRRLIYLKSKLEWSYDCPDKNGWACYLQFPCSDSHIYKQDIDYSTLIRHGHGIMDLVERHQAKNFGYLCSELLKTIKIYNSSGYIENIDCNGIVCNKIMEGQYSAITVPYLYHLNDPTKEAVERLNLRYHSLGRNNGPDYVGLHIRRTYEKSEMVSNAWTWIGHSQSITSFTYNIMSMAKTQHIFISTDDCMILPEVIQLLQQYDANIKVYSSCIKESTNQLIENHQNRSDRTQDTFSHPIALLSDIEMLRKSSRFIGLFYSDFVRLIHRLRQPNPYSYALAPESYKDPDIINPVSGQVVGTLKGV
jgi:hypothetical protein